VDYFEAVRARRSIRKYTEAEVPREVMEKALDAAVLAPNSSNLQTWEFYWVQTPEKKKFLRDACLNQSAARTAKELVVVVANPALWEKTNPAMLEFAQSVKAPRMVLDYHERHIPLTYGYRYLALVKWLVLNFVGLFKPIVRGPTSFRDLQEVSIKSAALASENFMLAISAQGFASCPMEGFDEVRVKSLLNLQSGSRVVMVVSVGEAHARGTWGPQVRFDRSWFVKEV
jgi:nitroreductase